MIKETFPSPDDDMFALWRAVFALVHADGNFSEEEKNYIEQIIDVFSFNRKQKKIIKSDLKNKPEVTNLFKDIKPESHQRQFFVMARTIIWCDGYLHELEREAVNKIAKTLGKHREKFNNELHWIERKPVVEEGRTPQTPKEDVMKIVFKKMSAFYKEKPL